MSVWLNGKSGPSVPVHAKNGGVLDVRSVTPITTNPVVAAPTGDTTYLRIDGGNAPPSLPIAGLQTSGDYLSHSGRPFYDVRAFGAVGDGVANDTAAINSAVTACSATGGWIFFPIGKYKANFTLPFGCSVQGVGFGWTIASPGVSASQILTAVAGTSPVITVGTVGGVASSSIRDVYIAGNNTGATDQCISIPSSGGTVVISNVTCSFTGQQGIIQAGPSGHPVLDHVLVQGALHDATNATRRGAIEIHSPNAELNMVEAGAGVVGGSTITNAALNNCGVLVDGAYGSYSQVVAEEAEAGMCLTANAGENLFNHVNANLVAGHGWIIVGSGSNQFSNSMASNFGQATASTYDGFNLSAASSANLFSNVQAVINGGLVAARWGVNDQSTASPGNNYTSLVTSGTFTGPFNSAGAAGNSSVDNPHRSSLDRGDNNVTLQAVQDVEFQFFNTPLTLGRTVTLSTTGVFPGAHFRITRGAAATGASTLTVLAKALTAGQWIDVEYAAGAWVEVAFGSL